MLNILSGYIDFVNFNGPTIIDDLKNRDFTINAMAANISEPERIIDPLSGEKHLKQKKLCPCSGNSFYDDPVRTLRAIRFLSELDLTIDDQVIKSIREATEFLYRISHERIRDELFKILSGKNLKNC